jgi:aspartate carbamoyltransferase catalytic subunit
VEIASDIADDVQVSLISEQVEMGVALRMAILDALARGLARDEKESRGTA